MEIFLLTFGTIITFFTFYYQFQKQPNKEVSDLKEMVLLQFKINQKLSIDLKNNLEKYASQTNSHDSLLFEWATFRDYINLLDKSQKTNLSNEAYLNVKKLKSSNTLIFQSFYDTLKPQYDELNTINLWIESKLSNLT